MVYLDHSLPHPPPQFLNPGPPAHRDVLTSLPLFRLCPLPGISFAFLLHLLSVYTSLNASPPRRHGPPTPLIPQKAHFLSGLPEGIWSFFSSDINHFLVLGYFFFFFLATILAFSLALEPTVARDARDLQERSAVQLRGPMSSSCVGRN